MGDASFFLSERAPPEVEGRNVGGGDDPVVAQSFVRYSVRFFNRLFVPPFVCALPTPSIGTDMADAGAAAFLHAATFVAEAYNNSGSYSDRSRSNNKASTLSKRKLVCCGRQAARQPASQPG